VNGDVYNPGASAGDECRLPVHLEIHEASPPVEHSDEDLSGFSGSNSVSIDNLIDPGGHKSTALSPHVEGRLYGQFEKAPHRRNTTSGQPPPAEMEMLTNWRSPRTSPTLHKALTSADVFDQAGQPERATSDIMTTDKQQQYLLSRELMKSEDAECSAPRPC
jgi:hypothetical protein